jgi:hypothetical protein
MLIKTEENPASTTASKEFSYAEINMSKFGENERRSWYATRHEWLKGKGHCVPNVLFYQDICTCLSPKFVGRIKSTLYIDCSKPTRGWVFKEYDPPTGAPTGSLGMGGSRFKDLTHGWVKLL